MRNGPDISTNTHVQIDQSIFADYGTHAINYFMPLGIFMCQGRRTQDAGEPKSLDQHCSEKNEANHSRLDTINNNSPHWLTQKICRQIPSHQVSIPSHYH